MLTEVDVTEDRPSLEITNRPSPKRDRVIVELVAESLAGRADRINAFSIATDVLGPGSSFDGSTDPVVRIEAGRVRRLDEHR